MTFAINMILIAVILVVVILAIYYLLKKDLSIEDEKNSLQYYKLDYLVTGVKETITAIQNTNIEELNLNEVEAKKRENQKATLDRAVRYCCTGDIGQKEYLKDYITEILQKKYNICESTIDYVIPFEHPSMLTITDKFDRLLYIYRKKYKNNGYSKLNDDFNLDQPKLDENGTTYYSIDKEDIEKAYQQGNRKLSYVEKLDIVTQRIYQMYSGHGIVDVLREEKSVDGVSGGVSGSSNLSYEYMEELLSDKSQTHNRYDSVWMFFRGKPIRMKFMSFGTQRELERIVHNLYRNGNPGWMSSLRGFIINDTKDGNRITVARPPFNESFAFWIRKFDSTSPKELYKLLPQKRAEIPITILKNFVRGMVNFVITGETNCGKTTLLKGLVQYIDNYHPIRTLEAFFELWLSRLYPDKNISGVRETDSINTSMAISFIKKTDASVIIAGESADFATAAKVVELCVTGTKMTMSTNHSMTADGMVEYHTNAVMAEKLYSDDFRAERSVASSLNFDIHMVKSKTGERYIERITEIIPLDLNEDEKWPEDNFLACFIMFAKKMTRRKAYTTKDIVVYENGQYVMKNPISERILNRMRVNLSDDEYNEFTIFISNHLYVKEGVSV